MRSGRSIRRVAALASALAIVVSLCTSIAAGAAEEDELSYSIKEARTYAYKASLSKEVIEVVGRIAPCDPEEDPYECDEGRYNHKPNCPPKLAIGPQGATPKAKPPPEAEPATGGAGDEVGDEEPPQSSPVRLNRVISLATLSRFGPIKEAAGFASEQYVDLSGRSEPEAHTESDGFSPNKASYEERCFPKDAAEEDQNDYTHVFSRSSKQVRTYHLAECFRRACTFSAPSPGTFGAEAERARSIVDLHEGDDEVEGILSATVEELSYGSGAFTVDSIETYVTVTSDGTARGLEWSVTSTASGASMGGEKIALPPGETVSGPGFAVGMAAPYVSATPDGSQVRIVAPGLMIAHEQQAFFFGGAEFYAGMGEGLDFSFTPRDIGDPSDPGDGGGFADLGAGTGFDTGAASLPGDTFGGGVALGPTDADDPLAAEPSTEILIYEQATGRGAVAAIVALGVLGWVLLLSRWFQRYSWGRTLHRLQPFRAIDWLYRAFVKS